MSDKDLIRRGEVEDILCNAYDGTIDEGALAYLISELKKIPAVPHEITARELFSARDRMCNSNYDGGHIRPACRTCPLWRYNNGYDMYCGTLMTMRPLDFLAIVEEWAQEHPEGGR